MSVEEFIEVCRARGLHFTANWVAKRLREIQAAEREPGSEV